MATKLYHMASKVNERGGVSALCFAQKRSIDLRRASWGLRPEAVTCPRCKRLLAQIADLGAQGWDMATEDTITRYDPIIIDEPEDGGWIQTPDCRPAPDGAFVRYEDHQRALTAALRERDEARARLEAAMGIVFRSATL
jgi:hypothetical protein